MASRLSERKFKPRNSSSKPSPSTSRLGAGTNAVLNPELDPSPVARLQELHKPPPASTHPATGFFPNSHSFKIHGSQFLDVSSTTNLNVYNGVNVNQSGLDLLLQYMEPSAIHNSADRFDAPKCDEDTRTAVIEEIMAWIKDTTSPTRILCMTGPAGTGKSALEQTIAQMCESESIPASFFFSASDSSRDNKNPLIATIAYQIAQSITDARPYIAQAAWEDPSVFHMSLERQLEVLIVRPLRRAAESRRRCGDHSSQPWPHAILIDGLDECRGIDHQSHILSAIHKSLLNHDLHFRIFLASRPEYPIRTALDDHLCDIAYHIVLDDKYNPDADIQLYLQRRLTEIGRKSGKRVIGNETWPKAADIRKLVENASGQFIYAATVIKFVSQRQFSPSERLQLLLTWTPDKNRSKNPFAMLDAVYHSILSLAQDAVKDETDDPLSIVRLLKRIWLLNQYASKNDSISFLEQFPFLHPGEIETTLTDLHALVQLSSNKISFHHKSFTDFLDHPSRSGKYYISTELISTELVVILDKHMFQDPKAGINFCFNASMSMFDQYLFWIRILILSAQDDRVLRILEAFDFERWTMVIKSTGVRDCIRTCLECFCEDIQMRHAASGEWLRIHDRLKNARDTLANF